MDQIIAYIGKPLGNGMGVERDGITSRRELTDWHGNHIGTVFLGRGWRVNSYVGERMYQAYATVNGVKYTGRTFGEGMSFKGKRCAKQ